MDIAGEERPNPDGTPSKTRDSTVVTIGCVSFNNLYMPSIEMMHQGLWTGMNHAERYAATCALIEQWNLRALCIDNTSLGQGLASLLIDRFNSRDHEPIMPFTFSRPSKSRLAYQLTALANRGGVSLYTLGDYPSKTARECWNQLRIAKYRLYAPESMDFFVDPAEGHDDFLISLALLCEALEQYMQPAESAIVKPVRLYGGESLY
jgi:hypothetical protein